MQQYEAVLPLQLKELKLSSFNLHWQESCDKATKGNWSYSQYLSVLCSLELEQRVNNRLKRHIKESKLPTNKTLSSFDFSATPRC